MNCWTPVKGEVEIAKMYVKWIVYFILSISFIKKGNYELLKASTKTSPVKTKQDEDDSAYLVTYQGSVIDIQNLLLKVEKSEQDRLMAERKIDEMEFIVGMSLLGLSCRF